MFDAYSAVCEETVKRCINFETMSEFSNIIPSGMLSLIKQMLSEPQQDVHRDGINLER